MYLNALGAFDFIKVQSDPEKDIFYANFLDYELGSKDTKAHLAFISIIQKNRKLSTDRIPIQLKRKHYVIVLPTKMGHTLIFDYDKKNKTLNMHLEKINIE